MPKKVLIIDDDQVVLFIQKKMVVKSGLAETTTEFSNPVEALEYVKNDSTNDFLLLLDIKMPEMSGWDFLDAAQNLPNINKIKVVMVSSSIDEKDHAKAKEYDQVIGYMEKPLDITKCQTIASLLG